MQSAGKIRILNANALKFLGAILMLVDHIGVIFFPNEAVWRVVGRLSMPLFAFALSEGCRYTKNKVRHFFLLFAVALVCQVVYYFFNNGDLYMSILITFSLSVLTIYAMQYCKKTLFDERAGNADKTLACLLFLAVLFCVYAFCQIFTVDYGFWGVMTPVFASVFDFHRIPAPKVLEKLDCLPVRVLCLGVGLFAVAISYLPYALSFCAFGALPLLLLYNGEKGKWKTKYFFYVFYPLHLALLEGVYLLLG